jgi:ABC-type glutathione transport system ATPase component
MKKRESTGILTQTCRSPERNSSWTHRLSIYSTGMHTRLAFAAAAHLEKDILLLDEVLVVGDVAFQRKWLGGMNEAAKNGRTVVFVSHDLTSIAVLRETEVLLDHGVVLAIGSAKRVMGRHLNRLGRNRREVRWALDAATRAATVQIVRIWAAMEFGTLAAVAISTANFADSDWGQRTRDVGAPSAHCTISACILNTGTYFGDATGAA